MKRDQRAQMVLKLILAVALLFFIAMAAMPQTVESATITVPGQYPSIQAAINAAGDGDTIVIAPGTYNENLTLDKSVTLRAATYDENDPRNNTAILDGGGATVVTIPSGLNPGPTLTGLVIRNGDDGISPQSPMTVEYTYFTGSVDQIDYEEGSGGICRYNVFENADDDAIDLDEQIIDITIEHNVIRQSGNDGIEIRLQDNAIPELAEIVIRDNEIAGSVQDGIQIIDYAEETNRLFIIERNLILNNGLAGIGLMDNQETDEDFRAASITERIHVFNNTFVGNDHGISGGDNLIALNNIFQGHVLAVKNVDGNSTVSHNLFWQNTTDNLGSNVDGGTTLTVDPLLDSRYQLQAGSPAIDAGTPSFTWQQELVLDRPADSYAGTAPDLGWQESGGGDPAPTATTTATATVTATLPVSPTATVSPTVPRTPTPAATSTPTATATPGETTVLSVTVGASSDDAEEDAAGVVDLTSSDLELVEDGGAQTVGMRFSPVAIPPGATVFSASIQFQVDDISLSPISLTLRAEAADNAVTFSSDSDAITARPTTTASVFWAPPVWPAEGEAGAEQRTPNLASLIQEVIDRAGWISGNALAIIVTGSGERSAVSYDGDSTAAPRLHIGYAPAGGTIPPAPQPLPHSLFLPAVDD